MTQIPAPVAKYFWNQDEFYNLRDWPVHQRERLFLKHKSNLNRYILFKFLAYNGLHPDTAIRWITMGGTYDKAAFQQLNWLKEQHLTGALYSSDKGYTWDMHHKKMSNEVGIQVLRVERAVPYFTYTEFDNFK